ncbi:MAG TPA: MBOAT family O-acyltransferase [Stellaceae bacterium]|nr:MBOAT family O-acyltransferase [Stellaceae bacterium]
MLFPTLNFGLFFLVVFFAAWLAARWPELRTWLLIAASYFFYAFWDWRFMALLFASSTLNYLGGKAIHRLEAPHARKLALIATVALNLGVLGVFKYFNFFADSLNALLFALGSERELPYLDVALPVGISFFTFHGISYVADLHRGALMRPAPFAHLMLYISFFPQLVAGPIVRASFFLPQIEARPDTEAIAVTRPFLLIAGGLFKKVVLANYLATDLVDGAFFDPASLGVGDLLLAIYGYALQIYCDFSAYTDIAIGVAALLGFSFPQNFNQPYRAQGLQDFWRRWHISLSTWLRDYLYIFALGGDTGDRRRYRNLMVTMLLGGLWHGARWTFVTWGALHGLALVLERAIRERFRDRPALGPLARAAATVATFHFVCLTWIFFRAPDFEHAFLYLEGFTRLSAPVTLANPFILLLVFGTLAAQFLPADRVERLEALLARAPMVFQGALLGLAIVAIDSFGPAGVAPFIYFQF